MINVLIVSPTGGKAGIDVCLDNLVSNLDRKKFRPVVVLPENAYFRNKFQEHEIQCYELPLRWWFPIGVKGHDLVHYMANMCENIEALCDIINIEKIDIILSNTTASLDACIAGLLCGKKHAYFMHAMFVDNIYTEMSSETKKSIYQFMARSSERIICCSEVLSEEMQCFGDNVCAINNGIDTEKFSYTPKELNDGCIDLVCFGHFNQNKQQDFVLEALRILKKKDINAYSRVFYTAVGPGETMYLNTLNRMVDDYGLKKHVIFEDFEENVQKRLGHFNLYVNSSITETMPLSVMEAMSSGLPVLCTRNNGNMQIVREGIDGLFCDTPEDMADNLVKLLNDPDLIPRMSQNARARIEERFSIERYVKSFEALFEELYDSEYRVNEQFRKAITKTYNVLVEEGSKKRIKVLTIYPYQAIATYAIAAEQPFSYLSELGLIEEKAVEIGMLSDGDIENADLIFLIRFFHEDVQKMVEKIHSMRKAVVWYIDDNYLSSANRQGSDDALGESYVSMFKLSDCVVVNNEEIFQIGKKRNDKVFYLPTYQTLSKHDYVSSKAEGVVRFGFMGTLGRDSDFEEVEKAVEQVISQYQNRVEVEFIGYCPEKLKTHENVHHFDFIFDYRKFRDFFEERQWDFAIAPLRDTQFNRSKTNNKYREYSSFAIPAVFSKMPTYTSCIRDGVNGLLVENTQQAWYDAICRMMDDGALRAKLAENAYRDIADNYKLEDYALPLYSVLKIALIQAKHTAPSAASVVQPAPVAKRSFTKESRRIKPKRRFLFAKTDVSESLRLVAPNQLSSCYAFIPGLKHRKIHFSEVIPFEGYFEYPLKGIGNNINLCLVCDTPAPCHIEIVENQQIIYGEIRMIQNWAWVWLPVGAINGQVEIRFRCMSVDGIIRVLEHSGKFNVFAKPKLLGWIS